MKIDEADGDKNCNCSCGSLFTDSDRDQNNEQDASADRTRRYTWLDGTGRLMSRQLTDYEGKLEEDVEKLQDALFAISSHYAKIQFRLQQIACASGNERLCLLRELQRITCQGIEASRANDTLPILMNDAYSLGDVRARQKKIISQMRSRLTDLVDVTDYGFCIESESSYNLRKSERTNGKTSSNILMSDGTVEHGKYCPCIICQENREQYSRMQAYERGYLAQTCSPLEGSDIDVNELTSKSKSKKKRHKAKGKKSDKTSNRRLLRRGSPNRYYRMSYEDKTSSQRSRVESLYDTSCREKNISQKSILSSITSTLSGRKSPSQKSQYTLFSGCACSNSSSSGKSVRQRSTKASPNGTPRVGKSASQRGPLASSNSTANLGKSPSQRSPLSSPNSAHSVGKSPSRRSPLSSPNSAHSVVKSPSRRSPSQRSQQASNNSSPKVGKSPYEVNPLATPNHGPNMGKVSSKRSSLTNRNSSPNVGKVSSKRSSLAASNSSPNVEKRPSKRSQRESLTSSPSGGKSLGPRSPQLSFTGRSPVQEALPMLNTSVSTSKIFRKKSPVEQQDTSQGSRKNSKAERKQGSQRESVLSQLSNKLGRRSTKASIGGKPPINNNNKDKAQTAEIKDFSKRDTIQYVESTEEDEQFQRKMNNLYKERGAPKENRKSSHSSNRGSILSRFFGSSVNKDQDQRASNNSSKSSKELTPRQSRNSRKSIKEDQYERKSKRRSTRSQNGETNNQTEDEEEDKKEDEDEKEEENPESCGGHRKNHLSCNPKCKGKCSKAGKCVKIRECQKKYEAKKKCREILKSYSISSCREWCALGYCKIHKPQQLLSQCYQNSDRNRIATCQNGCGQCAIDDEEDEEEGEELGSSQGCIPPPGSPQEQTEQDQTESSSNADSKLGQEALTSSSKDEEQVESITDSNSYIRIGESQAGSLPSTLSERLNNSMQSESPPDDSPCSTRSMVEITNNIERDNTNRVCKSNMKCQRPNCQRHCIKTVEFVQCPHLDEEEKTDRTDRTEKRIFGYVSECQSQQQQPTQSCIRNYSNRPTASKCYCVKSQPAHYQVLRPFSHHSMMELPLVYPHAIGKPRNRTYIEQSSKHRNQSSYSSNNQVKPPPSPVYEDSNEDQVQTTDC